MILDDVAQRLGHPTFPDIRFYEWSLPQHGPVLSKGAQRPRLTHAHKYLFFPQASWGSGWNNIFQEQLLNTHLAYLAQRSYVFPTYIARDHPPIPDTLDDGTRHWLHIPMNAFVSGPTGGRTALGGRKRPLSEEWWNKVCPLVVVVKLYDDQSDGEEMMARWANKLLKMEAPCVSVEGKLGPAFDYLIIGSERVLSLWPLYGKSPALQHFAWSPLITETLFRNFHVLSPHAPPGFLAPVGARPYRFQSYPPYRPSASPFTGLLGVHVRRGDFDQHCVNLANGGIDYNAWNLLGTPGLTPRPSRPGFRSATPDGYVWPALPDYLDVPEGKSRRDAAFDHCWPSPEAIAARIHKVRAEAVSGSKYARQDLRKVYIASNGDSDFIGGVAALLRADGWDVSSSLDMELSLEGYAVSQAVDMAVLTGAESFIGVGFSSLTSNVVQIRLGAGRAAETIHFW
ncbi:hypothetical protein C8R46DRAFT_924759 [Mycena filopes]|nr:hypothetical protein C8R46DRAFT_924759 [Mycena filopes]